MADNDRITKDGPRERDGTGDGGFEIEGNVRLTGQDPSPANRGRGEQSDSEPEVAGGSGGTRRS